MSIPMTDWQGTRRAQLRNNQSMSGVMDFLSLPYGDGFTMVGGTSFDSLVQFTGQQYNQEDNLYNFKTRYLGDWVGRFMSPDWSEGPDAVPFADFSNPQSLNLYSYGGNNPLSNTDDDGHDPLVCAPYGAGGQDCKPDDTHKPCDNCTVNGNKVTDPNATTVSVNSTFLPLPSVVAFPIPQLRGPERSPVTIG